MYCPDCDGFVSHAFLRENEIEPNEEFNCPSCGVELRQIVDESSYTGAINSYLEVVDG